MAFRRNISPLFLVPSSLKDFVDCLDLTMEAQQNLDTSETTWPTSYKILILRPGNALNPLNAKLNHICHLLALLGALHILHVGRIRVKIYISSQVLISYLFGTTVPSSGRLRTR
jgi:hypothetical protein